MQEEKPEKAVGGHSDSYRSSYGDEHYYDVVVIAGDRPDLR